MTAAALAIALSVAVLQSQPSALRIVVLEGEDAVNVIQQKTAVRPLVEVRDRNNVPVAGATVTFTIAGSGQPAAFAGGVQTLTVTTNAAGQAGASGLDAISSGAFQIQVQAAYQGQIATAAISQTNLATAAAAGGGGGGMSGTTIAIIGAAVAGGAVAATQVGGSEEEDVVPEPINRDSGVVNDGGGNNGAPFNGPFSGQIVVTTVTESNQSTTCISTRNLSGTLRIQLSNGVATGTAELRGSLAEVSVSGSSTCTPLPSGQPININVVMSGAPTSLAFTMESSNTAPTPNGGGSVTATETWRFMGSVSGGNAVTGNTITGTLTYQHATRGNNVFNGSSSTITGNGSTNMAVTVTR